MEEPRYPIRTMVVDDHPIVRAGVGAVLEADPQIRVVGKASAAGEAVERCAALRPAVVVVDLRLRSGDGVEAALRVRAACPAAQVLILTSNGGDEAIYRALDAEARGYLLKDAPPGALAEAVRAVAAGKRYIPPPRIALTAPKDGNRAATPGEGNKALARQAAALAEAPRPTADRANEVAAWQSAGRPSMLASDNLRSGQYSDRAVRVVAPRKTSPASRAPR